MQVSYTTFITIDNFYIKNMANITDIRTRI